MLEVVLLVILLLLLLHYKRRNWVKHVLVLLSISDSEDLGAKDSRRRVKLLVFHQEEAFTTDAFICALMGLDALTEDRQSHMLTDEVRIWSQLDQVGVDVPVAKLADEAPLNHFLISSLVVRNLQRWLAREGVAGACHCYLRGCVVHFVSLRCRWLA